MGKIFSDTVEQALEYVCYNERARRGKEGFAMLEEASAAGDGDASCILARCLWGVDFIWAGHQFPEDDARGEQLIRLSVEQGSAIGVLLAVRMQKMTPSLRRKMKFASLQEAFDIVQEKAEAGDAFCQYTIGNMYFWWDFLEIQGKSRDSFSSLDAYRDYLRENISNANVNDFFLRLGKQIFPITVRSFFSPAVRSFFHGMVSTFFHGTVRSFYFGTQSSSD